MTEIIKCSIRNIGRKRLRTFLTIASIAIGVASVVLISSIGSIGRQTIQQELSSLGFDGLSISRASKDSRATLTERDLDELRQNDAVQEATGLNFAYTQLHMRSLSANGVVWGIDDAAASFISLEPVYGRMINRHDIRSGAPVCVVDQSVANAFYRRDNIVGKTMRISLGDGIRSFTVVGVVRSGGNLLQGLMTTTIPSFVYLPYSTLQQSALKTNFDQVVVRVAEGMDAEQAGSQLVHALEARGGVRNGYRAEDIARQRDSLDRVLGIVTLVLSLIAGISLIVAGLGIMTVMIVSVHERTHEIGIKKSIGASRCVILFEFLVEAFVMTLIGSVIGAAIGAGCVSAGCLALHLDISLDFGAIAACVGFSVVVGVIFGVYPAATAARLRPVDALRSM